MKAVFIGDTTVGKTAMFNRLSTDTFQDTHIPTVGGAFTKISVTSDEGRTADIGLWDTAGQERFRNIVPMYFQRAEVILVVYSVTDRTSFENVDGWVEMARSKAPPGVKLILIGNKSDLIDDRLCSLDELRQKKEEVDAVLCLETSAKTGDGFDILMSEFAKLAIAAEEHHDSGSSISEISQEEVDTKPPCAC